MDEYDTFIYSGNKVVIRKGKDFSKNELKSRLHQMNIDFDISKSSKTYFTNLYDEALYNNSNKIKIIDKLKGDTERLGLLTNKQNYIQNNRRNFISDNEEAEEETIKNKKKEKGKKIIIKDEIIDDEQLNSIYNSNERKNNNSFKENNKSDFTNVLANQIRENKQNKRINAFEYNSQNNNNNEINYEDDLENTPYQPYNNLKNRPRDYSNFNNNKYNNRENNFQGRYDNNKKYYGYDNRNQFYNERKEYNNSPIDKNERKKELYINDRDFNNLEKKLNDKFKNDYNNKKNLSNKYNDNYKQKEINYNKLNNNERKKNYRDIYQENEYENNNNSINIPVNNNNNNNLINRKRYRNYALEKINEENYLEEEGEEIQDNTSNIENKSNIDLLLYILFIILGGLLIYFVLKIIFRVSNTLTEGVTQTVRIVTNPKKLFRELIWGLIKAILMGILYEYIYVTLPLAVLSFVIYMLKKRREFNKLCKQIIEDIKKDLENKMDKSMSENEIIDKYSQKYNIDKNIFIKKYLKALRELRKKDHLLKLSQNINSKGVTETIWELRN